MICIPVLSVASFIELMVISYTKLNTKFRFIEIISNINSTRNSVLQTLNISFRMLLSTRYSGYPRLGIKRR